MLFESTDADHQSDQVHPARGTLDGAFSGPLDVGAITLIADHGGSGPIDFRRLLARSTPKSNLDFVDLTVIPAGSSIGRHEHTGNEELYLVVEGRPLMRVDSQVRRLDRGDISIVRTAQCHELVNDTSEPVTIFVVQVRL